MGPSGADPCQSIPTCILPRQSQKKSLGDKSKILKVSAAH